MAVSTVATAVRATAGAFGFLTRLPVGRDGDAWTAFAANPAASVVPGYVVGALAAAAVIGLHAVAPGVSPATVAFAYVLAVYALVGINNLDGVADCGDAAVVHGDQARRREVLGDTTTGVGALAAVALVVAGLALGALAVAGLPVFPAVAVVVATEVGTRVGLAVLAALASAPHDGLGSAITEGTGVGTAVLAFVLAVPALAWPAVVAPTVGALANTSASAGSFEYVLPGPGAFAGALAGTAVVGWWAHSRLGGANGDAFGAATEVARVAGLHAGVLAWTLS